MKRITKILLISTILLTGCTKDMNDIIEHEPYISGTVMETYEKYILIENKDGMYSVSLDVENRDSMTHFNIGDVM